VCDCAIVCVCVCVRVFAQMRLCNDAKRTCEVGVKGMDAVQSDSREGDERRLNRYVAWLELAVPVAVGVCKHKGECEHRVQA
jgi:hypothetical protein